VVYRTFIALDGRPPLQHVRVRIPGETFPADRNGLVISICERGCCA
jgi:hypothetical protein